MKLKTMTMNNEERKADANCDPLTCPGEKFIARDDVEQGSSFDEYGRAYGFGVGARGRYPAREYDDVESGMSSDWAARRGASSLSWERARHPAWDAGNRIIPSS